MPKKASDQITMATERAMLLNVVVNEQCLLSISQRYDDGCLMNRMVNSKSIIDDSGIIYERMVSKMDKSGELLIVLMKMKRCPINLFFLVFHIFFFFCIFLCIFFVPIIPREDFKNDQMTERT